MRLRTLLSVALLCMGFVVPGHTQNGLIESLGFNVPCEGVVQPSCSQPLSTVNTGTCYIYVCNDGVATGTDGTICPTYGECLANESRSVSTDANGCPKVTCTANTGCVGIEQIQCPATQLAVESGNMDDLGCPIFSCQPDPSLNKDTDTGTCATPNADGTCPETELICDAPPVCPTGFVATDKGKDDKGCDVQTCEQKVCPQVATCPAGYLANMTVGDDGCKKVKCTLNDNTETTACPVPTTCPTGYTSVSKGMENGCPRFECTKSDKTDNDDDGKTDDKTVDSGKSNIVEAECRGSDNKECKAKVQCPAGLYAYHIKGACNTRWGSVTDAELDRVPMGTLAVVKPSSQPAASICKIADKNVESGSDRLNRDQIILDPTKPIKFSCRDIDKNGGECHIRVAVQCMPPVQYWAHTRD